jgi:hypothetical protein
VCGILDPHDNLVNTEAWRIGDQPCVTTRDAAGAHDQTDCRGVVELCLLKRVFSLRELMLRPTMDSLPGDDVGALLAPSDSASERTFARRALVRNLGVTAPTAGAAARPARTVAALEDEPIPLSRPRPHLDGWRTSLVIVKPATVIAWHRCGFQLWWTWKSGRHGTTDCGGRRACADSHVRNKSAAGAMSAGESCMLA